MNVELVIKIGKDAILTLLLMAAPMLLTGAFIGVILSMVQSVTQLRDQSITFIPKIVGVFLILLFSTPFLIKTIVGYTYRLYDLIEKLGYPL